MVSQTISDAPRTGKQEASEFRPRLVPWPAPVPQSAASCLLVGGLLQQRNCAGAPLQVVPGSGVS